MGKSDCDVLSTVSGFGFSAQRPETLGASEYTLVTIATDVSGSVSPFKVDLEKAYRDVIGSCRKNPRAENLLVRATTFRDMLNEEHGFQGLDTIDENKVAFSPTGGTALFDSLLEGIEAVATYGKQLSDMDYLVNALVVVTTHGYDNSSRIASPTKIKKRLADIRQSESLESIKVIIVGVGDEAGVAQELNQLVIDAGLDQFIHVGKADAKSLAKAANFISRSISSGSTSLGSGGPSQNLTV